MKTKDEKSDILEGPTMLMKISNLLTIVPMCKGWFNLHAFKAGKFTLRCPYENAGASGNVTENK